MKLWVDDFRVPPSDDWVWVKTVKNAISAILWYERQYTDDTITISLDHDAGYYSLGGGDYIEILNWIEREGIVDTGYFFHIHSINPVEAQNMRAIIEHNGWREIK